MKLVEVLKVPVRYKGVTHQDGQTFEMEEAHVNENIVKVLGDVDKTQPKTKPKLKPSESE